MPIFKRVDELGKSRNEQGEKRIHGKITPMVKLHYMCSWYVRRKPTEGNKIVGW